jgi:outer membrane protein assembly factor BamA
MSARGLLAVIPLFALCIQPALGQLPKRVEKCLPYPTLAQEIRDMQPADPVAPAVTVRVNHVEFDRHDGIPEDAKEEISEDLRSHVFHPDAHTAYLLDDLANEIAEVAVRGALQNRGYFKATPAAKLTTTDDQGTEISVAAILSAEPGPQYRAGDIRVESADGSSLQFSPAVLRGLIPLQTGDLFNVGAIRTGLDNLRRAYVREGYVDMTAEPVFDLDEAHETIDMVLKINQQAQYRIGSIELLGVNAATQQKLLKSLPKSGEIFDGTRIEDFLKVNRSILPPDVSKDDVNVSRDLKARTVAILFDLRTCPPHSN